MAPEIADSDAESELNSPVRQQTASENIVANIGPSPLSLSTYDFDQYIDPTQRLSSHSPKHAPSTIDMVSAVPNHPNESSLASIEVGTVQSIKLFGELSPVALSKKRAHSALQDNSGHSEQRSIEKGQKPKRSKTYGTTSKSRSSEGIDLFAPLTDFALGPQYVESADQDSSVGDHTPISLGLKTTASIASISSKNNGPNSTIPLTGQSGTGSTHRITTSVASMGQYSSIDLDFRGAGQGMNIYTNPFGSLSQASLDEDLETRRLTSMVGPGEGQTDSQGQKGDIVTLTAMSPDQQLHAFSQVSAPRASGANPSRLAQNDGAACEETAEGQYQDKETARDVPLAEQGAEAISSVETKSEARKRGSKAKNSGTTSESPAPGAADDLDGFHLQVQPSRSRRGTVDSLSQASQTSATHGSSRRRKRGKSKHVVEEETTTPAIESTPMKAPTSELNLSDEALIGLPKEEYKPRPSRSRSKRVVDEEMTLPVPDFTEASNDTPARASPKNVVEFEDRTPCAITVKSSTKKGRKSKVKRAKTSAAALLKKTDPMLSEGEEDVLWLDTKPAPVKLDMPPDLKVLKKETEVAPHLEGKQAETLEDAATTKDTGCKITVEIPSGAEAKGSASEPKKRGRKPKKVHQKQEQRIGDEEEEQEEKNLMPRPALMEKSRNTSSAEKETATESTETQNQSAKQSTQEQSGSPDKENLRASNDTSTTPSKPAAAAEKGPTKHSPINPPNLSSGRKTIYRIGLSRRQNIPSLLRKVQRDKPPPKLVARKEKENKKKKNDNNTGDGDHEGDGTGGGNEMRGPDGMLIEWGD